jgi:hypothetical protein
MRVGIRTIIGIGKGGKTVERAGENEGEDYQRKSTDLVGPGAQCHGKVVVVVRPHLISPGSDRSCY